MLMTIERARLFADSWYRAWNERNLDFIMSHYDSGIEHSSPYIKKYNGTDDVALRGIGAVRAYFNRALEQNPDLRFDPVDLAVGLESVVLIYRRMNGALAAEVFFFGRHGRILRSVSHYG